MVRTIFIDGGAHSGETVELIKQFPQLHNCEIFFFEPTQRYIETLKKFNATVVNKAIWIDDCTKQFYESHGQWGDVGNTIHAEKQDKLDATSAVAVECVDFAKFLEQFNDDDYVFIKLDIEGSEYDVLNHLLTTGAYKKIDELWVEWHDGFYPNYAGESRKLTDAYNAVGIPIKIWPH